MGLHTVTIMKSSVQKLTQTNWNKLTADFKNASRLAFIADMKEVTQRTSVGRNQNMCACVLVCVCMCVCVCMKRGRESYWLTYGWNPRAFSLTFSKTMIFSHTFQCPESSYLPSCLFNFNVCSDNFVSYYNIYFCKLQLISLDTSCFFLPQINIAIFLKIKLKLLS